MDHDKHGDQPSSTGGTNRSSGTPVGKDTAPSSTPMAGLRFGSFGAASAPGRLWGDRVETGDLVEQQLPPLFPISTDTMRGVGQAEFLTPTMGRSPRKVASAHIPLSAPTTSAPSRGGSPRQAASALVSPTVASTSSPTTHRTASVSPQLSQAGSGVGFGSTAGGGFRSSSGADGVTVRWTGDGPLYRRGGGLWWDPRSDVW